MIVLCRCCRSVNKSVSKVLSDLHSVELRGEKKNPCDWLCKGGKKQSAFVFFEHKKPLCFGCYAKLREIPMANHLMLPERLFWRLSDCNLELLRDHFEGHPLTPSERYDFLLSYPHAFTLNEAQWKLKRPFLIHMRRQIQPLFIMLLYVVCGDGLGYKQ